MIPTSSLTPSSLAPVHDAPTDDGSASRPIPFGHLSVRVALPDSAESSALSEDHIDPHPFAPVPLSARTATPRQEAATAPALLAADSKERAKDRALSALDTAVRALLQGDVSQAAELPGPCSMNELPALVQAAQAARSELSMGTTGFAVFLLPLLPTLFDTTQAAADNRDRLTAALRTLEGWDERRDMAWAFRQHDWQDGAEQSSAVCLQALTELLGPDEAFRACCDTADSGPLDVLLAGAVDALVGDLDVSAVWNRSTSLSPIQLATLGRAFAVNASAGADAGEGLTDWKLQQLVISAAFDGPRGVLMAACLIAAHLGRDPLVARVAAQQTMTNAQVLARLDEFLPPEDGNRPPSYAFFKLAADMLQDPLCALEVLPAAAETLRETDPLAFLSDLYQIPGLFESGPDASQGAAAHLKAIFTDGRVGSPAQRLEIASRLLQAQPQAGDHAVLDTLATRPKADDADPAARAGQGAPSDTKAGPSDARSAGPSGVASVAPRPLSTHRDLASSASTSRAAPADACPTAKQPDAKPSQGSRLPVLERPPGQA